jgi:hypothetical protein
MYVLPSYLISECVIERVSLSINVRVFYSSLGLPIYYYNWGLSGAGEFNFI